jgi:hypothetical protein
VGVPGLRISEFGLRISEFNSAFCNPQWDLLGSPATDLFKISYVIEDGALIFGVAVSADPKGYFPLHTSLFWMSLPFSVTGLTLDPLKVKRNF